MKGNRKKEQNKRKEGENVAREDGEEMKPERERREGRRGMEGVLVGKEREGRDSEGEGKLEEMKS